MRDIKTLTREYNATLWGIRREIASDSYFGYISLPDCGTCTVIWGYNESGYEHVSVAPKRKWVIPTWDDMTVLKSVFFDDDEEAYQIMPKGSEYVNLKTNCLHLWRPKNGKTLDDLVKGGR